MAQADALLDTLKAQLRAHKIRYREVAQALSLSEASIKRLFSTRGFDLPQLECICRLMGLEISDLFQAMHGQTALKQLTLEQEQTIASDATMLLVTVCVLNRWRLEDLTQHYQLTEAQCIQLLAKLDRMQVIDLLPKNRIKLKISPNFRWRPGGPIERFFMERLQRELFQADFSKPENKLHVLNGMLSTSGQQELQRKLDQLIIDFERLNQADARLDVAERHGTTLVLAMRDWQYQAFRTLNR
ncbi:helix-turn-helix domain-containing protein [Simiduia agarivorans]|uniref:HTH cro/C1-type domain-containing protein n=1 Tax=Simiduia agarivorans (strain DSM 21679 / JCM 13881 / BCRC 17597 / SA1) TaxID=1117647 RepID=K4KRC8_SIMAS|nr:helix-turn-helix transcriptional regulator [Simiduia agarivorans]AFV00841.1 hypothetical protein M5M_18560 [Simiduia agarivorans SA1 = DSM 21679]